MPKREKKAQKQATGAQDALPELTFEQKYNQLCALIGERQYTIALLHSEIGAFMKRLGELKRDPEPPKAS